MVDFYVGVFLPITLGVFLSMLFLTVISLSVDSMRLHFFLINYWERSNPHVIMLSLITFVPYIVIVYLAINRVRDDVIIEQLDLIELYKDDFL